MINKKYDPKDFPQLNWAGLVGLFALPVGWWFIVLHVIGPRLLQSITTPEGEINGYALNLISLSCYLFEFLLAVYVLRRERQTFTWSALGWQPWRLLPFRKKIDWAKNQVFDPVEECDAYLCLRFHS